MFALLYNIKSKQKSVIETNKLRKTNKQCQSEPGVGQTDYVIGDNVQFIKNRQWVEAKVIYLSTYKSLLKKIEVDEEGNIIMEEKTGKTKKELAIKSDDQLLLAKNKKQCIKSKDEASKEFNKQLLKGSDSFEEEISNNVDETILATTSTRQVETQEQKVVHECSGYVDSPWFTVKITADMILMQEELLNHMKIMYQIQTANGYEESNKNSTSRGRKKWDFEPGKVQLSKNFNVWIQPAVLATWTHIAETPQALLRKILEQFFTPQELAGYSALGTGIKPGIPTEVYGAITEYVTTHKGPFNPSKVINQVGCNRAAKYGVSALKDGKTKKISKETDPSLKRKYDDDVDIASSNEIADIDHQSSLPSTSTMYHSRSDTSSFDLEDSLDEAPCNNKKLINCQDKKKKKTIEEPEILINNQNTTCNPAPISEIKIGKNSSVDMKSTGDSIINKENESNNSPIKSISLFPGENENTNLEATTSEICQTVKPSNAQFTVDTEKCGTSMTTNDFINNNIIDEIRTSTPIANNLALKTEIISQAPARPTSSHIQERLSHSDQKQTNFQYPVHSPAPQNNDLNSTHIQNQSQFHPGPSTNNNQFQRGWDTQHNPHYSVPQNYHSNAPPYQQNSHFQPEFIGNHYQYQEAWNTQHNLRYSVHPSGSQNYHFNGPHFQQNSQLQSGLNNYHFHQNY